jgi:hypothetical protein
VRERFPSEGVERVTLEVDPPGDGAREVRVDVVGPPDGARAAIVEHARRLWDRRMEALDS